MGVLWMMLVWRMIEVVGEYVQEASVGYVSQQ